MIRLSRLGQLALGLLVLFAGSASLPAVDLLYVTLSDNTVASYDTTGNNGTVISASKAIFTSTNISNPWGLSFNSSGNLYAANFNDNTVSMYNPAGTYLGRS